MTEKLKGCEWLTWREAFRWWLVSKIIRKGDAGFLADGLYHGILYHSLGAKPDLDNPYVRKMKEHQTRRYQLYAVLRWMQCQTRSSPK